jgi:hypothetical protein
VPAEEVAVEVRGHTARRRGEQHHPDGEFRPQVGDDDQAEAEGRQQDDLADHRDDHEPRVAEHAAEIVDGEPEAEAEHDDGQRDGQSHRGQPGIHAGDYGRHHAGRTFAERRS